MVDNACSEQAKASAQSTALELGLDTCIDCKGCRCEVGIDLKTEVIKPLLLSTQLIDSNSNWPKK